MKKKSIKAIGIIPCRYHSTRFEGKPLVNIFGKPMIQHVYERTKLCKILSDVIIATDDERIKNVCLKFTDRVVMTSKKHKSGTDRICEVAKKNPCDVIINIQGDEPFIEPKLIEELIVPFYKEKNVFITTAVNKINNKEDFFNPNIVKVVIDKNYNAIYFSRAGIPYQRKDTGSALYKHIGIYAYKYNFLFKFTKLGESFLEKTEELEQLRAIEHGYRIKVIITDYESISVDTPEDLEKIKLKYENK